MNKKGSWIAVFIWAMMGIFFIALIVGLIVVSQKISKEEKIEEVGFIILYLGAEDSETSTSINSNYLVATSYVFSEGELKDDSLLELKDVPLLKIENNPSAQINVYCWGDHYFTRLSKNFTQVETDNNASKVICLQDEIGNIEITHEGGLNKIENIIALNITTDKHFNKLSAVLKWSSGIINVEFRDNKKTCKWENLTYFEPDHYSCIEDGVEDIEVCELNGEECTFKAEIPERFKGEVDMAIHTGKDLNKESYEIFLYVKTEESKIDGDFLEIIFYDKDIVWKNNRFIYSDEVGNPNDFGYRINYKKGGTE